MNIIKESKLKKLHIAVVYGGKSKERAGSLVSGKAVLTSLKKQGFNVFGVDSYFKSSFNRLVKADVVFLILHGRYGEDGKIQGYLESLGIPYTGSGVLASSIGMDKHYFKVLLKAFGIPTPEFEVIAKGEKINSTYAKTLVKKLGKPLFLKPISEGGSLGASVIHNERQLIRNYTSALDEGYDKFIVEKYINGSALTVGLLEINRKLKVLPILQTISKKEFYDYEAKHNPDLHIYKCPAPLYRRQYKEIQHIAERVYKILGCYGFCRVDFMIDTKNHPYVLEVNTLPGMSLQSNMAVMANTIGISYDNLVVEMLKTAFRKPAYLP